MTFLVTPAGPNDGGSGLILGSQVLAEYEELCHCLIGHPRRVQATIRNLEARRYVDSRHWTPIQHIPPEGLLICPSPNQVCTFLFPPEWQENPERQPLFRPSPPRRAP